MAIKKSELYSSLWASCDELRGGMDASQYKDYVLFMLFIKYISDKYGNTDDFAPPVTIPKGASFKDMIALKNDSDIGNKINTQVIQPLIDANQRLARSDFPDFNDPNKLGEGAAKVERLSNLISIFQKPELDFSKNRAEHDDILGDAYEYLMRHFATESGKSKGQFYTPAEVSRIMAKAIGISRTNTKASTTAYDPTCGSGSLLLKVAAEAGRHITLEGQERDVTTAGLARMNMILHDFPTANILSGNTLSDPKFKDGQKLRIYDYVVANPPFSDKTWSTGLVLENDRFQRLAWGVPPKKQGDYAYLLHIIRSMKGTGKAACILPHGVLFRGNAEAVIRKELVLSGYLKAIIGLPANLFFGTGIPACIVVLDKENATARKGVFMIDASRGFMKDGPKNRLRERDIHLIVDTYQRQDETDPRYARMIPISEIADPKNDYNLNLPRYIDSTEPEDLQDIDGHLRGGIPVRDIDDPARLKSYWSILPAVREALLQSAGWPGYYNLRVPIAEIKATIFGHTEFVAFQKTADDLFEKWKATNTSRLEGFKKDGHPKQLIETISEDLLGTFKTAPLLDAYGLYQHLMDYWAETMQDDCYLIAADGWKAGAQPREIVQVKNKENKLVWPEKHDFKRGKRRFKSDLIPAEILIARYFTAERDAIAGFEAELANVEQQLDEKREEQGGEEGLLSEVIEGEGDKQKLLAAADTTGITLYQANLRTHQLLRYGVPVQLAAGQPHDTVHLIDWEHPEKNDFALAEEVTLRGGYQRRPDLVIYINGIAVGVIELKRSSVEVGDGVRQLITNQEEIFNKDFFATVQFVFAGSDSQGLRYGTVTTREEFFVEWKASNATDPAPGALLDRPLAGICEKTQLLDLIRNCIIFDNGIKKVPRPHQYVAVKKAQERLRQLEGGVIWHTQGSGKSILMVLLAKWIMEYDPEARILVVTDRDELDKQIEGVMKNAGVIGENSPSPRITSRAEFVTKLGDTTPRLLCALIHKFDPSDLKGDPPPVHGNFYVFVDECHRTQGGDMNTQMKRWLAHAIFIGFTGTPLLRKDKKMTRDVFGTYIDTYKFHQAVADEVILDLKYEARDVPQRITSKASIDAWFERKTKGLNNFQRAAIRKRWANMEELMSAQERKQRIIASIIEDFSLKPRLNNDRGTALLVAASIYDTCHYYRLLQNTPFGQYCGIVTSYEPNHNAISREPPNSDERYKFDTYTKHVLKSGQTTNAYEDEAKRRFIEEPANLKLLIVVSKLLTGFDAPSCTYIYLDNELRDHNLFQAICRTNRLDGEDKDYGYIVDFKELFGDVQQAIAVYNSDELDIDEGSGDGGGDNNVTLKDWLVEGKQQLDLAREELRYLCDPVPPPREMEQYLRYFCGDASKPNALAETEPLRISFYKGVAKFVRAYADIAQNLTEAGYSDAHIAALQREVGFYGETRAAIKKHSGEELDIKPYEADMRHLLNTYVQADPATDLGNLDALSLTEAIIDTGIHDAIARKLNEKGKLSRNAIAEGIINNVRKTIIRDQLTDPRFYAEMSKLLDDLVKQSRTEAAAYEEFLKRAEDLVKHLAQRGCGNHPALLNGLNSAIALFNNLASIPATTFRCPADDEGRAKLALEIDRAMRENAPAGWRGDVTREKQVLNALFPLMSRDRQATQAIFDIIKNQPDYL